MPVKPVDVPFSNFCPAICTDSLQFCKILKIVFSVSVLLCTVVKLVNLSKVGGKMGMAKIKSNKNEVAEILVVKLFRLKPQ